MKRPAAKATIRDVAREARVSVASVSRALNDLPSVTREMRERVRVVARELGYVPHAGARSLSLSRTHVIGVVLPDLHGEFFSELVRGMDRATTERGYQMLFSSAHADPELARQAIASMHGRVDGLIVMAPQVPPERVAELAPPSTPTILVNSPPVPGRDAFRIDNHAGAALMARHLVKTGRRRILHITGPMGNIDARERRDGFLAEIAAVAPGLVVQLAEGDFQEASGAAAVERTIALGDRFDAIFAANDGMAMGALLALRAAGLKTPSDVMVAGFDDIPFARFLGLTTLRVPMSDFGALAVGRLCERLEGDLSDPVDDCIAPDLIIRETTGGPA